MTKLLDEPDVLVQFQLRGPGKGRARFFTCDFTEGYIKINGSYRT
ncbi:MAG: bifunctional ornithine acetyltransferase/N-acetylglutamate synthase [Acidobacteriota bacterium]